MSDQTIPGAALPAVTMPEVSGAMGKPSRGSLSSEMEFTPAGMAIKSLEQGMALAKYLVAGGAAPKGWSDAQVFLAMQAGLEHGLGYTGGIQAFVIINNMPAWKGQAAAGKIRSSRILKAGTLDFGCDEDPTRKNPDGTPHLRGWCTGQRVGDSKLKTVYFTQQEAVEAGLWGSGANWSKFRRRMLMWRAVGFLTKDLFGDVLGNFPIAEELYARPEDFENEHPKHITAQASALLSGAAGPSADPLMDELSPQASVKMSVIVDEGCPVPAELLEKIEVWANDKIIGVGAPTGEPDESRFRNLLAAMDDAEDYADLERRKFKALTAAGGSPAWEAEVEAAWKKLAKRHPKPKE